MRSARPRLCSARAAAAPAVEGIVERVFVARAVLQQLCQPLRLAAQLRARLVACGGQSPRPGVRVRQGFAAAQQSGQGGGEDFAERRMRVARRASAANRTARRGTSRRRRARRARRAVPESLPRARRRRPRPRSIRAVRTARARDDRSHRPWLWRRRVARSRTAAAMAAEGRRAIRYRRPEASNQSSDGPARTVRLQLASSCSMPSPRLPCNCRADKGFCPYPHELWISLCILLLRKRP